MTTWCPPRILVVADAAAIRFTFERLLRRFGYVVKTAANATEAFALLLRDSFDLVLLDFQLPGISGLDIASVARELYPAPGIVLLTSSTDWTTIPRAALLGINTCLPTFASPQAILNCVVAALPGVRKQGAKRRS